MKSFNLVNAAMGGDSFEILCKTASRVLGERGLDISGLDTAYRVTLATDSSLSNDRYIIKPSGYGATLTAANDCALHAAFGRLMLLSGFDGRGGFVPCTDTVDFTPAKSLRGMYFATHFNNFYHNAPLEEVYEVIGELALRGCNNLLVWFDMHHYASMSDPAAISMAERLRSILKHANKIGMGGSLTMLSNEAFYSSPVELRAEWIVQGDYHTLPCDHYHVEICPSKQGGIEEILRERREMLSYFSDLRIDYVVYWPYDQGGCTCKACQPWGANGFLKLLPHFEGLICEVMPQTKVIVSTWYFDKFINGEWQAFYPRMTDGTLDNIPYVMSFFFGGEMPECIREGGIPVGTRFIDFPEISMYSCYPWGGFGASVLTRFLGKTNGICSHLYDGGFPYSEGVFEDANKFIQLCSYTGLYPDAADALRAYVRYEFCCDDEELYDAILRTETSLERGRLKDDNGWKFEIKNTRDIEYVRDVLEKYKSLLPQQIANGRKFRLLYLRSVIDYELMCHDFRPADSGICLEAMHEVNRIYHVSEKTRGCVCAPCR